MICNIMNGRVFKGGPAEITVPVLSECLDYEPNYISAVFYTTGDTRIEFTTQDDTLKIDGVMGTVYFSEVQLESLPDGHLVYTTYYDDYVTKDWDTKLWLVTPQPHTTIEYVTTENVDEIVDEKMEGILEGYATEDYVDTKLVDYATSAQVETMINDATSGFTTSGEVETMITEAITGVTGFTTVAQVESMISSATNECVTSGEVETMITGATSGLVTSAEVQTTLEDYAKLTDIPSLDGYATESYVNDAVTAGTQNMVTSSTIHTIWFGSESQYNQILIKDNSTLYVIE